MTAGFTWERTPTDAFANLVYTYNKALLGAVLLLAQVYAPQIEAWMKANAVWTDRTGNARQTLHVTAELIGESVELVLSHGMDYGRWLEWANQGRFAILAPAIDEFAPKLFADIQRLVQS